MLHGWLSDPEVRPWWGDPDEELALIRGDLPLPSINQFMVHYRGTPVGYIQDYNVGDEPDVHFEGLPAGTRAIDLFVGGAPLLCKGHGSAFLRQHALSLLAAGAPKVVIDPLFENLRARRAYQKAGFVEQRAFDTKEGRVMLMVFEG